MTTPVPVDHLAALRQRGFDLMAIEWEDAAGLNRVALDEDLETHRVYKLTVGFVVKETDDYVMIVDDIDLALGDNNYNNFGSLIPRGCIRARYRLSLQRSP